MTDLLARLRETYESVVTGNDVLRNPDGPEAAARIEQLEAALRDIATGQAIELPYIQAIARAALEDKR